MIECFSFLDPPAFDLEPLTLISPFGESLFSLAKNIPLSEFGA
jgi:hypothetical protein